MSYNMKGIVTLVLTGLIGIFIVLTLFNDLYSDTNSASDSLNGTMRTAGYTTAANLVFTGWKIVQYGLVFLILLGFGVSLFMKSIGKW